MKTSVAKEKFVLIVVDYVENSIVIINSVSAWVVVYADTQNLNFESKYFPKNDIFRETISV